MRTTPTHDAERANARDAWSPTGLAARVTALPSFVARPAVAAAAFHVAFVAGVTIIKSGTNALFLSRADPRTLPLLYAAVAIVVTLATTALARLLVTRPLRKLQIEATIGGAIFVVLGCAAVQFRVPGAPGALYVLGEATATGASVLFWSRVMDGFTSRDQKRVVGLVGAGGMLGAALGGMAMKLVVATTGVILPMIVAALLWIAALPLLRAVRARTASEREGTAKAVADDKKGKAAGMGEALRYLLGRGYPRAVALFVVLLAATGAASDFVFRAAAARTTNEVDMAALFGLLNAVVGVVVVFLQVGLTARLLHRLGVFVFAALVPALLVVLAVVHAAASAEGGVTGVEAAFVALVTLKGVEMAGAYSLHPAVVALLYNPMPSELRAQARTLIDGAIKKTGAAVAGLFLGLLATQGDVSVWTVFAMAALTLALLPVLRTQYVGALTTRLTAPSGREKQAAPLAIDPSDKTTRSTLERALASNDPEDVLNALAVLGKNYSPVDDVLLRLIEHRDERVRTEALARVPSRPDRNLAHKLLAIAKAPGARRPRAEAVRALSRVQPGSAADLVLPLLDDEEPGVVCAAIEVALRSRKDKVAQQKLDQLLHNIGARTLPWRREVARLLGALGSGRYTQALSALIDDADLSVRTLAIGAAAREGDPAHIEHLVRCLGDSATRVAVTEALVRFGDRAVPALRVALDDTGLLPMVRVHVPRVLQRIGSEQAAIALLFSNPLDDAYLQTRIATALANILAAHPAIQIDKKRTDEAIGRRLVAYSAYDDAHADVEAGGDAFALLRHALDDRRKQNLSIALDLLSLHRGYDEMQRVRRGLLEGNRGSNSEVTTILRSSWHDAIELLDAALVADPLRADFLSLLDRRLTRRKPERAGERARDLCKSKDPLLRGVAKHTVTRLFLDDDYVSASSSKPTPRHTGLAGTVELQGADMADELIEKLFMLEDVDLFLGLSTDDLLAIASIATEKSVEKGDFLYREGDTGEAHLYVIIEGVVDLTREGIHVMTLEAGESAGQVSFLDRGPRPVTARVSSASRARFLVVEREAFVDLMADRPSLMKIFLEVLATRLRALIDRVGVTQAIDSETSIRNVRR
jgi:HEAT repeat protein